MRRLVAAACLLVLLEALAAPARASLPPPDAYFGRSMLPYFMLAPGYKNFNHGSFGATPRFVHEQQLSFMEQAEARPDKWFRGDYQILVDSSREAIAQMVGAKDSDVVLVENASGGVNAVLRSLLFARGDKVLHTNVAYPMVTNTLNYLAQRDGLVSINMQLRFPATAAAIIAQTQRTLSAGDVKLCVFSHVTSVPAVTLPVEQLTEACHAAGALVLIDGAHALGQVEVNITQIGADFYVSNGHKWLYSPKGTAFLWVRPGLSLQQTPIVPTVISSSGKLDFVGSFEYTGTRDYTAFAAVTAALQFRRWLGDDRISAYNHDLAVEAGYMLAKMWGTQVLTSDNSTVGAMVNVGFPAKDANTALALQQRLQQDYDTYIVVYAFQNQIWTRLSAQIYLELQDFVDLGNLVLKLLK